MVQCLLFLRGKKKEKISVRLLDLFSIDIKRLRINRLRRCSF